MVGDGTAGMVGVGYAVLTGVNGGLELLIFVRERLIGMTCSVEPWSGVGYRGWPPASYSGAHLRTNCPWSGPQRIAGYRAGVRLESLSVLRWSYDEDARVGV